MRIAILTLGTRGDVEPYLALGAELRRRGHELALGCPSLFAERVRAAGFAHRPIGDELMGLIEGPIGRAAIEMAGGLVGMFRIYRQLADQLPAMQQRAFADVAAIREWRPDGLLFHPKATGSSSVAEALGIPAIFAPPLPIGLPTGAYPAILFGELPALGAPWNRWTHRALDWVSAKKLGAQIDAWRRETLGLGPARSHRQRAGASGPLPALVPVSPSLVPRPRDWDAGICQSGRWIEPDWAETPHEPAPELAAFLAAGPPPVYVGFGSMATSRARALGRIVREAVARAGQRAIVASGWGGLEAGPSDEAVHVIRGAPHGWLLPRCSAAVHHGGAGTTDASLRAGLPTLVVPFIADQPFWGRVVTRRGLGPRPIPHKRLNAPSLARALERLAEPGLRARAAAVGQAMRAERGLAIAADFVERVLMRDV